MFIAFIILAALVAALTAFRPAFRTAFGNFLIGILHELWEGATAIITFLAPIVRMYGRAIVLVLVIDTVLIIFGLLIHWPALKAISILLACTLYLITFFPLGVLLRAPGITKNVFPRSIRAYVSWLCFIGFMGMVFPEFFSDPIVLMGALLVIGVFAGLMSKTSMLPIAAGLTVVVAIFVIWKYIDADSFDVLADNFSANKSAVLKDIHRSTVEKKSEYKSTYGRLLKDVKVAYVATLSNDKIIAMSDYTISLSKDSVFLLVPHKEDVYSYRGQTFVEIKLPSQNGSFVSGTNLWIDADLIQLGIRKELDEEVANNASKKNKQQVRPAITQNQSAISPANFGGPSYSTVLYPGTHHFSLKAGQETPKFSFPDCGYYPYSVSSPSYDYEIVYSPRERYHGDPNLRIPEKDNPSFSIVAGRTETITIKVSKS